MSLQGSLGFDVEDIFDLSNEDLTRALHTLTAEVQRDQDGVEVVARTWLEFVKQELEERSAADQIFSAIVQQRTHTSPEKRLPPRSAPAVAPSLTAPSSCDTTAGITTSPSKGVGSAFGRLPTPEPPRPATSTPRAVDVAKTRKKNLINQWVLPATGSSATEPPSGFVIGRSSFSRSKKSQRSVSTPQREEKQRAKEEEKQKNAMAKAKLAALAHMRQSHSSSTRGKNVLSSSTPLFPPVSPTKQSHTSIERPRPHTESTKHPHSEASTSASALARTAHNEPAPLSRHRMEDAPPSPDHFQSRGNDGGVHDNVPARQHPTCLASRDRPADTDTNRPSASAVARVHQLPDEIAHPRSPRSSRRPRSDDAHPPQSPTSPHHLSRFHDPATRRSTDAGARQLFSPREPSTSHRHSSSSNARATTHAPSTSRPPDGDATSTRASLRSTHQRDPSSASSHGTHQHHTYSHSTHPPHGHNMPHDDNASLLAEAARWTAVADRLDQSAAAARSQRRTATSQPTTNDATATPTASASDSLSREPGSEPAAVSASLPRRAGDESSSSTATTAVAAARRSERRPRCSPRASSTACDATDRDGGEGAHRRSPFKTRELGESRELLVARPSPSGERKGSPSLTRRSSERERRGSPFASGEEAGRRFAQIIAEDVVLTVVDSCSDSEALGGSDALGDEEEQFAEANTRILPDYRERLAELQNAMYQREDSARRQWDLVDSERQEAARRHRKIAREIKGSADGTHEESVVKSPLARSSAHCSTLFPHLFGDSDSAGTGGVTKGSTEADTPRDSASEGDNDGHDRLPSLAGSHSGVPHPKPPKSDRPTRDSRPTTSEPVPPRTSSSTSRGSSRERLGLTFAKTLDFNDYSPFYSCFEQCFSKFVLKMPTDAADVFAKFEKTLVALATWNDYQIRTDRAGSPDGDSFSLQRTFRVAQYKHEVFAILSDSMQAVGNWQEVSGGAGSLAWNLLWTWAKPKIDWNELLVWQRVNHFPNAKQLTRKDNLKRHTNRFSAASSRVADAFDILPETFNLPQEYVQFVSAFTRRSQDANDKNIWILKPVGLSRGRGIYLFNDISSVSYGECVVVQRYIDRPLLLDGYKIDLRLYVLVTSFSPLEAFMYDEGFGRLSTQRYSLDPNDLHNKFIHLTNSSIQKHSAFLSNPLNDDDEKGGSKVSLNYLRKRLEEEEGVDVNLLWTRVNDVVLKSLFCVQDVIGYHPNSFELFGYDVLVDADLRPWLIEVNSSPSLARDNALDHQIKNKMMQDTIRLLSPVPFDRDSLAHVLRRRLAERNRSRWNIFSNEQMCQDIHNILHGAMPRPYGVMPENMGRYERICPSKAYDSICKMFKPKPAPAVHKSHKP